MTEPVASTMTERESAAASLRMHRLAAAINARLTAEANGSNCYGWVSPSERNDYLRAVRLIGVESECGS